MKIREITVSAGRTIPHPRESFSNFKFHVQLRAELGDFDHEEEAVAELQAQAETLAEKHRAKLLGDLEALWERERIEQDLRRAERDRREADERIARAKRDASAFAAVADADDDAGSDGDPG